ncbi:MAG: STAS domain-containing protein [Planctomycetaceae bacterium]|nr:STAS domain-containing protein [Planctomycetaceae bacterium]
MKTLGLQVEEEQGVTVLTPLDQELRMDNVDAMRPQVVQLLDAGPPARLLFDLQHVRFLSSSGLGLIVQMAVRVSQHHGKFAVCGADPQIVELFTGPPLMMRSFPLYNDRSSGVEVLAIRD